MAEEITCPDHPDCVQVDGYHSPLKEVRKARRKANRSQERQKSSAATKALLGSMISATKVIGTVKVRLDRPLWTGIWLGIGFMLAAPVAVLIVLVILSAAGISLASL